MTDQPRDSGNAKGSSGLRFGPLTMLIALVIGLGAGVGVAAAVSSGDSGKKQSGAFFSSALLDAIRKAVAKTNAQVAASVNDRKEDTVAVMKDDGNGGLSVTLATGENVVKDPQNLVYTPSPTAAVPDLPKVADAVAVAAANVIAVGAGNAAANSAGNVIAVGAGNAQSLPNGVIAVGAGNVIAVGAGNLNAPMSRYQTQDDTLPVTQNGCVDPWLTKAIADRTRTGTVPDGGLKGICTLDLYGESFGNYFMNQDDRVRAVNALFDSKCPNVWVTQAVLEVLHRQPNAPDCEEWRYGGVGSWKSYDELKQRVKKYWLG